MSFTIHDSSPHDVTPNGFRQLPAAKADARIQDYQPGKIIGGTRSGHRLARNEFAFEHLPGVLAFSCNFFKALGIAGTFGLHLGDGPLGVLPPGTAGDDVFMVRAALGQPRADYLITCSLRRASWIRRSASSNSSRGLGSKCIGMMMMINGLMG